MLILVTVALVAVLLHLSTMAFVGSRLGLQVIEFSIGYGPRIVDRELRGTRVRLGLILLGGYVRFLDEFSALPVWKQIATSASGATLLMLAGLALGAQPAQIPATYLGFVSGALHPLTTGAGIITDAVATAHRAPRAAVGGVLVALGAINLAPFPSLNGWQIITAMLGARFERFARYASPLIIVLLPAAVSWLVAVAVAVVRGLS